MSNSSMVGLEQAYDAEWSDYEFEQAVIECQLFANAAQSFAEHGSVLSWDDEKVAPQEVMKFSREDEQRFFERVRAGDVEARELVIACLQPFIRWLAHKYAADYSWASSFIEYDELFSELIFFALLLLIERFAKTLLDAARSASGYLRVALTGHISQ